MFRPGILVILLVAAAAAKQYYKPAKIVESGTNGREEKVLELLQGLGSEDVYGHEHKPFPYNDPSLFKYKDALKNFTAYWDEGFLVKYGIYTLNCERTIRDTLSYYYLLKAAVDFDTFYKVASWAKGELHPEMYMYPTYYALTERPDTKMIQLPPLYEILPNYFLPSNVLYQARSSLMNGVTSRTFQINNTGWEWSWHNNDQMTSPHVVDQSNRRAYDVESRLSYFREDVRGLSFMARHLMYYGLAAPNAVKEDDMERLGEIRFSFLRWVLARYNLERYAVGLPNVAPLKLHEPIQTGFDPQIVAMYGRLMPARVNNANPPEIDPEGVAAIEKIITRVHDMVEGGVLRDSEKGSIRYLEGIEAANVMGNKIIHGDGKYYSSLYFNLLSLIDGLASSSANRIGYETGILLNPLTTTRDPVYYQILAYINRYLKKLHSQNKPYTKKELSFPGVVIEDVQVSDLETYFEYHDFKISNALPGKGPEYNYKGSQFSINNRPYDITIKIKSDKQTNAVVKIFLGPAKDSRNRTLDLNVFRQSLVPYYSFSVKLQPGENTFKRSVTQETQEGMNLMQGGKTLRQWCNYPRNLMLPKGSTEGTHFVFYVMTYPYNGDVTQDDNPQYDLKHTCIKKHLMDDNEHTLLFPIDRHWERIAVNQSNHRAIEKFIYHKDVQPSSRNPMKFTFNNEQEDQRRRSRNM